MKIFSENQKRKKKNQGLRQGQIPGKQAQQTDAQGHWSKKHHHIPLTSGHKKKPEVHCQQEAQHQ